MHFADSYLTPLALDKQAHPEGLECPVFRPSVALPSAGPRTDWRHRLNQLVHR